LDFGNPDPGTIAGVNRLLNQLVLKKPVSRPMTLARAKKLAGEKSYFIGAFLSGKIIGIACVIFYGTFLHKEAIIEDVVVDSDARGAGLGEKMVRILIREAGRRGVEKINLTCRPERKAANKMYKKIGFIKRKTNVYSMDI
jgi:ribosomal protein S18 acetylase RimI-like enzyme